MAVQLNHTIVLASDRAKSAEFMAAMFGLPEPEPFGPFLVVQADNGVSLDFMQADGPVTGQHYAFLVSEDEFDQVMARLKERRLDYWADPQHNEPGQINTHDGGRGVYFCDPDGHNLEAITRPYGSRS